MNTLYQDRKTTIPLLLVALAFALNLHALAGDSFWGDEILTAMFAARSPAEVISWTAGDIHPPLYYLAAGAFTKLFNPLGETTSPNLVSDWLWRFPSVVAGVLTVAVTYRLALSILPDQTKARSQTAAFAALLLTFSPIVIKYSQEARMHALFMLLAAFSTLLLLRAMHRPARWTRWLAYSLAVTATIYTMYFGFLILAAHAGLLGLNIIKSMLNASPQKRYHAARAHRAGLFGLSGAIGLACLLYAPWWPVLFDILRRRAAVGAIEGGVGHPGEFLAGVVAALGPSPNPAAWGFLLLFGLGLLFWAWRDWPVAIFAGLWLALPTALPIVLGDPRALQFRYAFVLPVYLIIVAYGVAQLSRRLHPKQATPLAAYFIWILVAVSFIATLDIYQQEKPNWRAAASYLDEHTRPVDIILIGPLWDEGRFIDYYYRGQAQLLTPAAMVTNIERRSDELRQNGGRVWAVNRFKPAESATATHLDFNGVVVSEPKIPVYEPALLAQGSVDLAAQAVEAAYPWAAKAEAQGVLDPDPRTARAAALLALGDTFMAAGQPQAAVAPYQTAVDIFPGWVNGFIALAEAQQAVGNLPAAVEAYRQAVAFNSNWQGPEADEAIALARSGQWDIALQKYHQIVKGR